jgi:hypothetical protein
MRLCAGRLQTFTDEDGFVDRSEATLWMLDAFTPLTQVSGLVIDYMRYADYHSCDLDVPMTDQCLCVYVCGKCPRVLSCLTQTHKASKHTCSGYPKRTKCQHYNQLLCAQCKASVEKNCQSHKEDVQYLKGWREEIEQDRAAGGWHTFM